MGFLWRSLDRFNAFGENVFQLFYCGGVGDCALAAALGRVVIRCSRCFAGFVACLKSVLSQ